MHRGRVVMAAHLVQQLVRERQQFEVGGAEVPGLRDGRLEVLGDHRQRALREVAELVGQVCVDAGDDPFRAVAAILAERDLAQQEEAHRVDTELVDEGERIDHVAHRLAHLLALDVDEPVGEDPLGQLDPGRHQERRPVHRVEPDDVLADHVQVGRPVAGEHRRVGVGKAHPGQVVGQGVDPHVHDVVGVIGDGHAPVERGPRDRQIAQPTGDEADHLVAPHVGCDEVRMGAVVLEQLVAVGRQPEEVGLLLGPRHRRARLDRDPHAVAFLDLVLGEEPLVAHRVPARVSAQVDVAGVVHPPPDLLGGAEMVGVAGADEPVERDVEALLHALEHLGVGAGQLGGRHTELGGGLGHLLAVDVGAGQEPHVEAVESLEPGDGVGGDLLVGVADVRRTVGVVDRRGDVVGLAHVRVNPKVGGCELPERAA